MRRAFKDDEEGAVSIEYALIAVMTTIVIVTAVAPIGPRLAEMIAAVANALT